MLDHKMYIQCFNDTHVIFRNTFQIILWVDFYSKLFLPDLFWFGGREN